MHHPLLILGLPAVALGVSVRGSAARAAEVTTTVYVGRHFEVREHDQPVKYVFHGGQRVAHITGSLSSNQRLQRWRLRAGWNSISLAVTATNLVGQLNQFSTGPAPLVQALYQWQPATRDHAAVNIGQTIGAGAVLWLKARTNAVVGVTGSYGEPAMLVVPRGGGYVAAPGLENWSPTLPVGVTTWKYDSQSGAWRAAFTGDVAPASDAPPAVAPGEAVYVHHSEAVELELPDPARRILYYHPDHLGSAAVVADAHGQAVRESAYHPFGALRHDERVPEVEPNYGFARKEADRESGLADFGHRFLSPALGRWLNPDPKAENGGGMNPYAYVNQNPLKFEDPDGAEIKVTRDIDWKTKTVTYHIHFKAALIDVQRSKFDAQERAKFASLIKSQITQSFQGKAQDKQRIGNQKKPETWNFKWATTVDIREVDKWSEIQKSEHAIRIVEQLKEQRRGETENGGMLISLQRDIFNPPGGKRTMEETAAHEFGHAAGLGHDNRTIKTDPKANLMMEGTIRPVGGDHVRLYQIQSIFEAQSNKGLNKREPARQRLDDDAQRNP